MRQYQGCSTNSRVFGTIKTSNRDSSGPGYSARCSQAVGSEPPVFPFCIMFRAGGAVPVVPAYDAGQLWDGHPAAAVRHAQSLVRRG
jgi:hypothetical protein